MTEEKYFKIRPFHLLNLALVFILLYVNYIFASVEQAKAVNKNEFILRQLLIAQETIANSKESRTIDRKIPGSIVMIDNKKYQVVTFIFQDAKDTLGDETFGQYAQKNNLYGMKSEIFIPVEDIEFQVFDSAKSHIDNEVYFYISLQELREDQ